MMNEYFTQRQSNPPNTDTQWKKKDLLDEMNTYNNPE